MCQLLAICSNQPTNIEFSFREWRHRGCTNPHGFGFAYWDDDDPQIVKSASNLYEASQKVKDEIVRRVSRTFVCHVRLRSEGSQDGTNTHPFEATINGRRFVFAHNGTVRDIKKRPLRHLCPTGQTDSEHAFLWMLERLDNVSEAGFAAHLKELADGIRQLGRFNFLLSDGTTLWAYADDSLHYIERTPPYGGELVRLRDDGYAISLAEVKGQNERVILIATQPLTDEDGWHQIATGHMLVARDGRVENQFGN
jgi:predicted glutamine amidotransferase